MLTNRRAFLVLVRNELWRRVQLAALQHDDELAALDPDAGWPEALDAYFAEHDAIGTGPDARSAARILIEEFPDRWVVRQILDDPEGDHDWGITAEVDLAASAEEGVAVLASDASTGSSSSRGHVVLARRTRRASGAGGGHGRTAGRRSRS